MVYVNAKNYFCDSVINNTDKVLSVLIKYHGLSIIAVLLLAIGLFHVALKVVSYVAVLLDVFVLPPTNYMPYGSQRGAWAVVTGASDGIGKEYARQLGLRGFNVFLISRTESKLRELAKEIAEKEKVETKFLAIDVSTDSPQNYKDIETVLKTIPSVSILINNVGLSHSIPTPFLETPPAELHNIIAINNLATLKITQIVAPKIVESVKEARAAKKFQKGLILTMGSFGGLLPTPLLATYSGSKAFLQHWSNALSVELAPEHVDVELVVSYLVTSAMSKVRKTSALIPNPRQFVKATLSSVGRAGGAQEKFATSTPFWSHALLHWWIAQTVGVFSKLVAGFNYKMHVDIRKRALKKQARQAGTSAAADPHNTIAAREGVATEAQGYETLEKEAAKHQSTLKQHL
ncbi:Very-long-chain 3-oxoacyl-CoA reductase [Yarrowia sp. B02]|nr:Very-long-chain 3-oxoacyl-CoA reductase [Yarrowia sp. B02]